MYSFALDLEKQSRAPVGSHVHIFHMHTLCIFSNYSVDGSYSYHTASVMHMQGNRNSAELTDQMDFDF